MVANSVDGTKVNDVTNMLRNHFLVTLHVFETVTKIQERDGWLHKKKNLNIIVVKFFYRHVHGPHCTLPLKDRSSVVKVVQIALTH